MDSRYSCSTRSFSVTGASRPWPWPWMCMYVYDSAMAHVICGEFTGIDKFWNILEHSWICWNILEHSRTFWNILEHPGTFWNILKHFRSPWILAAPAPHRASRTSLLQALHGHGHECMYVYNGVMAHVICVVKPQVIDKFWNMLKHSGTFLNMLKNVLKHSGTFLNMLKHFRTF
jgi:hypothetical protein